MKINLDDFKYIPNGGKLVVVLRKLARLEQGESPYFFFGELMKVVAETNAHDSVPAIFPYLVTLALEKKDFAYLNFVATLKLGFYHRGDLHALSDMELRHYVAAMHNLKEAVPLKPPRSIGEWSEDFISVYVWNMGLIHSYSADVLMLSRLGRFEKAFKVKCLHCGNDIHSLYLDTQDLSQSSSITPREIPTEPWDYLFFDQVYEGFMTVMEEFGELYFSKLLPYVYGTYRCGVCQEENMVMDAVKCYQKEEDSWYQPTEEFLARLVRGAKSMTSAQAMERWVFSQFVYGQFSVADGLEGTRGMDFILDMVEEQMEGMPSSIFGDIAKRAFALAETGNTVEKRGYLAKVYRICGQFYAKESPEKAKDYFRKGLELVGDTHEGRRLEEEFVLFRGEESREEGEQACLDFYHSLHPLEETVVMMRMEKSLSRLYCQWGELSQGILYQEKLVEHCSQRYGDDSDTVGEAVGQLVLLYLEDGQLEQAKEQGMASLKWHLGYLQEKGKLPRPFAHGRKRLKEEVLLEYVELGDRGRTTGGLLLLLGHVAMAEGNYKRALDYYKEGQAIWNWVSSLDFVEQGNHALYQAQAYEKLGKHRKKKAMAQKALAIYTKRREESKLKAEVVECESKTPLAEALLKK